jgi:hypothetical protein
MLETMNLFNLGQSKPEDLDFEETLMTEEKLEKPKLFQDYTPDEKFCISRRRILAIVGKKPLSGQKKGARREESMWDVDLSKADEWHFDSKGNFTVGKSTEMPSQSWLVSKNSVIFGPYTERELRDRIDGGELKDALVKREDDRGFVHYEEIARDLGAEFYSSERLNGYFEENVAASKPVVTHAEFFDDLSSLSLKSYAKKSTESFKVIEQCVRTKSFLLSKNSSIKLSQIEKGITGKTLSEAVSIVSRIVGLSRSESQELIELLLEESRLPILSNVECDGFIKAEQKPKKYNKR